MNISLIGKYALVCGASKGIGRAISFEFANSGANLILVARNIKDLMALHSSLPNSNNHIYISADLQEPNLAINQIKAQLPSLNCIDILINNTGGPPPGLILNSTIEDFNLAFQRHILSAQELVKLVINGMIEKKWGRIINIISMSVRQPVDNLGVSNTIRAAMSSWAKTLSNEIACNGITVNSILPGYTSTERLYSLIDNIAKTKKTTNDEVERQLYSQIPIGRFVKPEEIAYYATFLASEYANAINGTALAIDGGYLRTI